MSDPAQLKSVAQPAAGYNDLKYYFANLNSLFSIRDMLAMDMMTVMPLGGLQRRLNDIASMTKRIYAETTTNAVTGLLDKVQDQAAAKPGEWDRWDKANLTEMRRIHSHLSALPPDVYVASVQLANEGRRRHLAALESNKWSEIAPSLQQSIDLYRRIAEHKQKKFETRTPYKALLLGYASDISEAQMDELYDSLLPGLKALYIQALDKQKGQPVPLPLQGDFSRGDQMWLNQTLLQLMGFDFNRGTLSVTSIAPMAGGTPDDARVLVRCIENDGFLNSLEDTLYYGAKALYIQNLPDEWKTQPVGQDQGSLISHAVSMVYETILGRTPQFFDFLGSRAEGVFRAFREDSFAVENLYRLKKVIRQTPIRKDADELSKIFHDIMRYRIERDLINGTLAVKDLPGRWAAECKELVGIEPKNLAEGPLQNADWFTGRFGFIPTNTLSHIIAAQLHEALYSQSDDLPAAIARGDFSEIKASLNSHIFQKGRSEDALAMVASITGKKLDTAPLLAHLERRYLSDKR